MRLSPKLPDDHPCRRLCLLVFEKVAKSPEAEAFRQGLIGSRVLEMAIKAAAFDIIAAQDGEVPHDRGKKIANAVLEAMALASDQKW